MYFCVLLKRREGNSGIPVNFKSWNRILWLIISSPLSTSLFSCFYGRSSVPSLFALLSSFSNIKFFRKDSSLFEMLRWNYLSWSIRVWYWITLLVFRGLVSILVMDFLLNDDVFSQRKGKLVGVLKEQKALGHWVCWVSATVTKDCRFHLQKSQYYFFVNFFFYCFVLFIFFFFLQMNITDFFCI